MRRTLLIKRPPVSDAQLGERGGKEEIGQEKAEQGKFHACKFVLVKWEN